MDNNSYLCGNEVNKRTEVVNMASGCKYIEERLNMETNAACTGKREWTADLLKNLVARIHSQNIVPIIGTGVFYAETGDGSVKGVQGYLVEELIRSKLPGISCTAEDIGYYSSGFYGMTKLARLFEQEGLTLSNAIWSLFENEQFRRRIKMREEVYRFLEYGKFPLVVTTCRFNISPLCPLRNGNRYIPISYYKGEKDVQDLPMPFDGRQPAIFHLLGDYTENDRRTGVVTEYDFLSYLHSLQDSKLRPNNLLAYLERNRAIFTIGCNVPNWTFRLLLYSLKEEYVQKRKWKRDNFYGAVMNSPLDADLIEFLDDISFSSEQDEEGIYEKIEAINKLMSPEEKPKVMLSMCSEEYDTVGEEVKRLLSERFEVWLYKDHDVPDYWDKIREGLGISEMILPVITEKTLRKIRKVKNDPVKVKQHDKVGNFGVIHEWWIAYTEFKGLHCCPILYDVDIDDLKGDLEQCRLLEDFFFSDPGNAGIPIKDLSAAGLHERYLYLKSKRNGQAK